MALPAFVSIGSGVGSVASAGISVPWGSHSAGNFGLLLVETADEAVSTPAGWTAVDGGTARQIAGVGRITAFYKFAASGAESNASVADPGDHCYGRIIVFSGVHATSPIHRCAGSGGSASTTAGSCPSIFTEFNDCMIVAILGWSGDTAGPMASGQTNANLDNVTERGDEGTADGNGGGLVITTGEKPSAGSITHTTMTLTASAYESMTIALRPVDVTPSFTVAGTVTINGVPAANGTGVEVYDRTLGVLETTTTVAGGAGGYSVLVKFSDHDYRCVYDNGASYGATPLSQAV